MDRKAKILAVTAYANSWRKEILDAGALEIVEKPFTQQLLDDTIEKYIRRA
jgi:CheY-like chemotaxis protein